MADTHLTNGGTKLTSNDWSDGELSAAVAAYISMLRDELAEKSYNKAEVNRQLRDGPLSTRTKASVEFRMQNISATLYDMRLPRIAGYLPAKNVGSSVKERIRAVLEKQGIAEFQRYIPTADPAALAEKVTALRQQGFIKTPAGELTPAKVTGTTTSFVRDPAVKSWVLKASKGICEGCNSSAPFMGSDGMPYLEVHHVMPLSSFGSDRISNAVALCPNCHRRCHFAADRDEFKLSLYEKVARLVIEVPDGDSAVMPVFIAA